MAIIYNGTPITAVQYNGTTYTTVSDQFGYLFYACNPIRYCSNACVCCNFSGFEYKICGANYYARAVINYNGCHDLDACIGWLQGKISNYTNMKYCACMYLQLGCIHQQVVGCGYCGVNYTFDVYRDPSIVYLGHCEGNTWVTTPPYITSLCDAPTDVDGTKWTTNGGNCKLYSSWVRIDYCDYISNLRCQSFTTLCRPVLYPYCGHISANLKNGQSSGCTPREYDFIVNPLGSRQTNIVCCIRVC